MTDPGNERLDELAKKVQRLTVQHLNLAAEIEQIQQELNVLGSRQSKVTSIVTKVAPKESLPVEERIKAPAIAQQPVPPVKAVPRQKTPLEEFIGTNLLNKVGIAVLVFGLAIGAKYAIDHELISPLTRIVLGYLAGAIIIGFAIKLKAKYLSFSAVLLSGGMAVLYFMTFAAFSFYGLIPQALAFILMVVFTGFTVFASLQYNLKAIAIIGLVGAYAVPFLLSDGSGHVVILFSYMTIINVGILILSFKKAWKVLYYLAFALTWIIFSAWTIDQYYAAEHLTVSLVFSTLFFVTFYITFLAYKLVQKEPLIKIDVILLLLNSFIYYGFGYFAIEDSMNGQAYLGLFTLLNAVFHFIACFIIFRRQEATRDIFYFVAGMVLVFLTLAVPVQFNGNWVTLIWAAESALLFWIGRTKNFIVYERLSYALILLTLFSLSHDWDLFYTNYYYADHTHSIPFLLNIQFLSSLLVCALWGWMLYLSTNYKLTIKPKHVLTKIFEWGLPILLFVVLYVSVHKEIDTYWFQLYSQSEVKPPTENEYSYTINDTDLLSFNSLWLMIYSAVFMLAVWIINSRWINNTYLRLAIAGLSAIALFSFITVGLYELSNLRWSYLTQENAKYYFRDYNHILIRYICLTVMIPLLWVIHNTLKRENVKPIIKQAEGVFFHIVVLAILSSELINILELSGIDQSDRLALSILWGVYALGLIIYGLMNQLKLIRITAIGLFAVTLLKLFFYDMAEMSTISKTIVMIILGVLLLSASFLYNKFKIAKQDE